MTTEHRSLRCAQIDQLDNYQAYNHTAFSARFNAVDVLAEDMVAKLEPKLRQSVAIHALKALSVVSALAYYKVTLLPIIIGHFPFHWQIYPPIYGVIPAKK